ncbi:MAG: hypothetical protein GDA52_11400, partial [Rhodobacteraceae bacterium]|nr:hypothetical protein [Paracoccaceae bacterium]
DVLYGHGGDDVLSGELGDNTLDGGQGNDTLKGNNGNDVLIGGDNNDRLIGGRGTDRLQGGSGADYLDAGLDDDTLQGGGGSDTLQGGAGNDLATYAGSFASVTVSLIPGAFNSGGHAQGDVLNSIERIRGSKHADVLIGDVGNNRIRGEGGADTLTGGGGDTDYDVFIFVEDWADGTVITDFNVIDDQIKYKGLDTNDVSFANHDSDGDGTNDGVTATLAGSGNVLLLQGVDYDVLMDNEQVGGDGTGIFII